MNRRATGVAFIALATLMYMFGKTSDVFYGDSGSPIMLGLVMLGGFYLYYAEMEKPRP